jgi:hypothetical protein
MWHRYTIVRQVDGSDCGASALATVALHYGLAFGLHQVREDVYTDRRGAHSSIFCAARCHVLLCGKAPMDVMIPRRRARRRDQIDHLYF